MMAALVPFYSHALPQSGDYVRILPRDCFVVLWNGGDGDGPLLDEADRAEGSGLIALVGRWRELGRPLVHGAGSGIGFLDTWCGWMGSAYFFMFW